MRTKFKLVCLILCMLITMNITYVKASSDKVLLINWDHIKEVGNQEVDSVSCACFTMAYCRTILDKEVHYWYEYNHNKDDDQFSAIANWGFASYYSKYVDTKQEAYKAAYDSINKGRPIVFRVLGKYQHYVTVVGYTNVTDVNQLDLSNFLIIDSIPNSTKSKVTNLKDAGYTLYPSSSGYRYIYTNKSQVETILPNQNIKPVITFEQYSLPEHLIKGYNYFVKGTITSNVNINNVSLKIKDTLTNKIVASVTSSIQSQSYDIKDLAKDIDLKSLDEGLYEYSVVVKDQYSTQHTLIKQNFTVKDDLPFVDLNDKGWYIKTLESVYSYSLMNGASDYMFKPNVYMNRAMVATVLYRMESMPKTTYKSYFKDIKDNEYYSIPTTWAKQKGIINGYNDGTYKPLNNITREEMVTILCNYVKSKGLYEKSNIDLSQYKDSSSITPYAKDSMKWAIENKIITGKQLGTIIDPKGNATRAECAKMIVLTYELINKD